jgi:alpha-tubulin suppressor-like RCC1 family protein
MDDVIAVSTVGMRSAAITSDGSLWAWGRNIDGEIGDGTTTDRHEPVRIMDNVVSVSVGAFHTAAIRTDGSLWIWGKNRGLDFSGYEYAHPFYHIPTQIMDNVTAVSVGGFTSYHTIALRTDGSIWTWGFNDLGQLGDGTSISRNKPLEIIDSEMRPIFGNKRGLKKCTR